jgi:hypothetical protein
MPITPWTDLELHSTMYHDPQSPPHAAIWGRDALRPLEGESVELLDGTIGFVTCASARRPPLPTGGDHRFVVTATNEDPALPVLAYHVSQLRPAT